MAYQAMKKNPTTKFGEWLNTQMRDYDMGGREVAEKLHMAYPTIYRHRLGIYHPTFTDVIAYCWVFNCDDDPETIWKMADILIEEN